jgi:hypothetical protein
MNFFKISGYFFQQCIFESFNSCTLYMTVYVTVLLTVINYCVLLLSSEMINNLLKLLQQDYSRTICGVSHFTHRAIAELST